MPYRILFFFFSYSFIILPSDTKYCYLHECLIRMMRSGIHARIVPSLLEGAAYLRIIFGNTTVKYATESSMFMGKGKSILLAK